MRQTGLEPCALCRGETLLKVTGNFLTCVNQDLNPGPCAEVRHYQGWAFNALYGSAMEAAPNSSKNQAELKESQLIPEGEVSLASQINRLNIKQTVVPKQTCKVFTELVCQTWRS